MERKIEPWLTNEMWSLMNDDITDYMFSQGEKYLEGLYQSSDTLMRRCYMLIGSIVAVYPFIIMSTVFVNNLFYLILASLFLMICALVCSYIVFGIVKPFPVIAPGASPRDRLDLSTLKNYKERGETNFKKYELEALQEGIEYMEASIAKRVRKYKNALFTLGGSLSLFLISACVILLVSLPSL